MAQADSRAQAPLACLSSTSETHGNASIATPVLPESAAHASPSQQTHCAAPSLSSACSLKVCAGWSRLCASWVKG